MDLSEQLEALRSRIGAIEDREQIRNAIAAYGPWVDCGDSAAAAGLWAADGRHDVGGMGVSTGRDAIQALFDGEVHQGLIAGGAAHVLSPVRLEIDGDHATAIGYSCVFVWREGRFTAERIAANRWALRREGERWLVTHRTNRLLNGTAEGRQVLAL